MSRIRASKDFYEILGVHKECSEDDLKKAYKKVLSAPRCFRDRHFSPPRLFQLALQLHPDKNKAPHAEEAFKKISDAFNCLR